MTDRAGIDRRDFLRYTGTGAAALLAGAPGVYASAGERTHSSPAADLVLELTARRRQVALRSGPSTHVWSYQARVIKGDPACVQQLPDSYLGPTLRLHRGQRVCINFINALDQPSTVHWHGLHVPETMDGHPRFVIHPGSSYRYEFEVKNRAGTYWYHPHPHAYTAEQVYFGLAGLLLISDDEEQALALPCGEHDLPIVIQDRIFGDDNQLHYLPHTGPHTGSGAGDAAPHAVDHGRAGAVVDETKVNDDGSAMPGFPGVTGFFGDTVMINGRPNATFDVATRAYRLRILNASNSRTYRLAWQDGRPLTVIATDGGLLERPVNKDYVMLAPAERIEVWADFSRDTVGSRLTMFSLAFAESTNFMHNSTLAPGARFPLFEFKVSRKDNEDLELPQRLARVGRLHVEDAVNRERPKIFNITNDRYIWGINGRSFDMMAVAEQEIVKLGTSEVWEFANSEIPMSHAMHVHGLQFQVLERFNGPYSRAVADGFVDEGWQDTVLVMPGDRIRLLLRFEDFPGLFMYHCHMAEHAAAGLMRNFLVRA